MNREIILHLAEGTFSLSLGTKGGTITSSLHYGSLAEFLEAGGDDSGDSLDDQFRYGRYEGAIDALESIVLAAAQAGIDVQGKMFTAVIQTGLDAIGNHI